MKNLQDVTRHSIQVQLESHKNLDSAIIERVKELKAKRKFTATFRDMASLYFSLQDGDTSVLVELFPWLLDAIEATVKPLINDSSSSDNEVVLSKLDSLQRAIEAQQSGGPYQASGPQPLMVSGNLGELKPLPPPDEHDDVEVLLEVKEVSDKSGSQAAQNLINSMLAMQATKSDKPIRPSKRDFRKLPEPDELIVVSQTT